MRQETKQLFPLEFFAPNFHTHPHTSNEASVVLSYLNTQYNDSPLQRRQLKRIFSKSLTQEVSLECGVMDGAISHCRL